MHTLDSIYDGTPDMAPTAPNNDLKDLKVLTPPVSPNMYNAGEKSVMQFTAASEKLVDVAGVRDSASDNYDAWFSSGNMRSDELFPDLAI